MIKTFSTKAGLIALILLINGQCFAQKPEDTEVWEPEPQVTTPGNTAHSPPSDAIVLFDGTNLDHWVGPEGKPAGWLVADGAMTVVKGAGGITSKQAFGSVQLHIEWRTPTQVAGEGQGRGNSGVFLQQVYEVQVLDSYENRTYSNGQAASIYKQHIPLVNASRPPGEWQTYDIIYHAPAFDASGSLKRPAFVTVIHNGVLVQDHVEIQGASAYIGQASYTAHAAKLPIYLQDHSNPVSYRNIWVRELE